MPGIARMLPLLFLLALAACQGAGSRQPVQPAANEGFDQQTNQTYDVQTRQFQQAPPFGARSNQSSW